MEKLKVKHDHTLTDIIKVGIFAIFLLLPITIFMPNILYYAFNENANTPTTQVENTTTYNLKQQVLNGLPNSNLNNIYVDSGNIQYNNIEQSVEWSCSGEDYLFFDLEQFNYQQNDKLLISFYLKIEDINAYDNPLVFYLTNDDDSISYDITTSDVIDTDYKLVQTILTYSSGNIDNIYIFNFENFNTTIYYFKDLQVFNLTSIFGIGNEPTIEKFNEYFTNNYYSYNQNYYIDLPNGTYTNKMDLTTNIEFAWQKVWESKILNWTGNNNFAFTINTFSQVFGITEQSYIANYINYLMTLTAIYIIFDIVLSIFVKLTHMFNSK